MKKSTKDLNKVYRKRIFFGIFIVIFTLTFGNSNNAISRDEGFTAFIKVAISGFFDANKSEMNYSDAVSAVLRNADAPYNMIDKADGIIDKVTCTGKFVFNFKPAGRFYIQLRHRNSLEIWSRSGGEELPENGVLEFDFTDAKDKTFGNVLEMSGKSYCMWSGDVDQDGTIDGTDFSLIENDVYGFQSGYFPTDLNGDDVSDGDDFMIMEAYKYFYQIVTPETGLRPYRLDKVLPDNLKNKNISATLKNYPNPFNPATIIDFNLNTSSKVRVAVYDITGRLVAKLADGTYGAGSHKIDWNAVNYPSGTYICLLTANGRIEKRVMNLVK